MEREDHAASLRWHFKGCVLDESSLQLTVGGEPVEIERKPLEVLRYLLRHAGEVVTKDEVLEAVWPGRILSDTVLAKAISRIREALGEAADETIKTMKGYGYRLVAEVRVEQHRTPPPKRATLGLQRGDHPPLRPNWVLVAHLESGGRGEVWRVQHERNPEQRVLKFALDDAALSSLKREITLNRLLRSALGDTSAITPLLDWNLQEAPFFIELPYLPQGSVADWATACGGLAQIPLAIRLDVAAQIAEAVSAAHGVGVLHKDLKPANVLVTGTAVQPRIQLTDFGSGAVMEAAQLDALGITRMGLTQTMGGSDSTSGTPLYLAPEVLAAQPHTVRSDNYALGVLLYQLVAGDFKKPLSPGWERDIEDPLLREDIALAADGNPAHRLGDAEELARRIRTLPARRAEQQRQQQERSVLAAAEAARRDNQRLRSRRAWQLAVMATLSLGLATSLWLYRRAEAAQQQAAAAARSAESVSTFLADDLLAAADPARVDVKTLTVKALLDAAESRVAQRFANDPIAAAGVRRALASSYLSLSQTEAANAQMRLGWALLPPLVDTGSPLLPDLAAQLATLPDAAQPEDLTLWNRVLTALHQRIGPDDARSLRVATLIGGIHFDRGHFDDCFRLLTTSLAAAERLQPSQPQLQVDILHLLARAYTSVDRYPESIAASQKALLLLRSPPLAAQSEQAIGLQLHYLGRAQRYYGQLDQAALALQAASESLGRNARPDSEPLTALRWEWLELHLMQKQWDTAEAEVNGLEPDLRAQLKPGADTRDLLFLAGARAVIAAGRGDWRRTEAFRREQLAGFEARQRDPVHGSARDRISIVLIKLELMRALIPQGRMVEARALLASLDAKDLATVEVVPINSVSLHRAKGLLLLAEGDRKTAQQELHRAREILLRLCAPGHPWFAELDSAIAR